MSFKFIPLSIAILLYCSTTLFAQEKVGHFTLGLQSGILMPFGNLKSIYGPEQLGISNGLSFKYFPNNHFAMGLSIRIMNNEFKAKSKEINIPISQVPFTFDFEWYPTNWRLKPYFGFGGGLSFFTVTPKADLVNTLKEIPDTYTTPGYLATLKVGLMYKLSERFSLHAEGTYLRVTEPGNEFLWQQNDGTVYGQFPNKATFTLGLFYHFDE
jgi:Outer membrane protein beta-barrel domain